MIPKISLKQTEVMFVIMPNLTFCPKEIEGLCHRAQGNESIRPQPRGDVIEHPGTFPYANVTLGHKYQVKSDLRRYFLGTVIKVGVSQCVARSTAVDALEVPWARPRQFCKDTTAP